MKLIFPAFFIFAIYALVTVFDKVSCTNSWRDSGYGYKYTFTAGCMISIKNDNRWIPARNYRAED